MPNATIHELISRHSSSDPDRTALIAPGRAGLSYGGLHELILTTGGALNGLGIGRGDTVAVVLPNGPEMAAAFVAVSSFATIAPLNPRYRAPEFDFYLNDLDAQALVVLAGDESPAIDVARSRRIPIIELRADPDSEAGIFELSMPAGRECREPGPAAHDDVALVLHTSGTTSRPKMVPLRHANLMTSAANISEALALSSDDRCLNVMPLFHIHGLMGAVLGSLHNAASVSCTPGFLAPKFFDWLDDQRPTWYTAVPTMHQAILSRAEQYREVIGASRLRLIRSSSASLPPQIISALEKVFDVPVVEAYGMTEASHQIAINPLPPGVRKPGSVGLAAGPEVQIMSADDDSVLGANETGEVVIRGSNVTSGYLANATVNATAFTNGWFRTGDQGYLDDDGYLYLTGRLKEIINRGGEKISPREIDEVLLDHPNIKQAVTFAMPDAKLGEEVAAAVVLADGSQITEYEIREFVSSRLTDFKVPKRVVILDAIPTGATGKLQRIGLAVTLGLNETAATESPAPYVAPQGDIEELVADMWVSVLGVERIGVRHRFLDAGGDSMLAAQLIALIRDTLEIDISILDFFDAPTIAQQATIIERLLLEDRSDDERRQEESLVA